MVTLYHFSSPRWFAAMGAWDSQFTDTPIDPRRAGNLQQPLDARADVGADGIFSDRARGVREPAFLRNGDQADVVVCSPAPPAIALQIFNQAIQPKMIVRYATGEPMEKTLAWAQSECEGYMRT